MGWRGRKEHPLLQDQDLRRWYENVTRGSRITADVYLRRLAAFCQRMSTDPKGLAATDEKRLHAILLDFIGDEERKGRAGSYIQSTVKAVKSWLQFCGIQVTRPVRVRGTGDTPSLKDERVPTQEELRRIFLAATPRDRVSAVLMAHSGLRPEALGNYLGTDGLRLRDFPDLVVKGGRVRFETIPAQVVIRPELSKAGHRYFTFLGEEGCGYVVAHLEDRVRRGRKLDENTDLVAPQKERKQFVRTINVGDGIRSAIRAAGFLWRPYVLRSYFDTQLMLAESKGKVAHDYRVFWMGHKGSMEARYTTNKGRLPASIIDDMREAYERCEPFLSTSGAKSSEDLGLAIRRQLLAVAGFSTEEIDKLDVENKEDEEIQKMIREKLTGAALQANGKRQKVVPLGDVEAAITDGWEFVAALPGERAVVRLPTHERQS